MRLALRPQGPIEQLALWLNLAPTPVAETMFGMITARVLMAGVRRGIFAAVASDAADLNTLAVRLGLAQEGLSHLLQCLCALGHLDCRAGHYTLSRRSRRWLDPASPTYVGTFLDFNYDQWEWWSRLDQVLLEGRPLQIHAMSPDDPAWKRYITAMFELSRLAAPEVAGRIKLTPGASRLLDVAGGHGWFSAAVCKRYPGLMATVMDLPGSARVGRELIARAGFSDRVTHVDGDIFTDDLNGPYDCILYFQTLRHFAPEQNLRLFRRLHDALRPGGLLAVMDYLKSAPDQRPDPGAFVGLNYYLTTGGSFYSAFELTQALRAAGFQRPRCAAILRLPYQSLCLARRSPAPQ